MTHDAIPVSVNYDIVAIAVDELAILRRLAAFARAILEESREELADLATEYLKNQHANDPLLMEKFGKKNNTLLFCFYPENPVRRT